MINKTSTNPLPLISDTVGAIKLLQLHLQHPSYVDTKQASKAADDALQRLFLLDDKALRLAEALHLGIARFPHPLSVSVGLSGRDLSMLQITVMDGEHVMRTIQAKTVEGLRELLALGDPSPEAA